MKQRSEKNLVLQAMADPNAFGELVEANYKPILWKCYRRVRNWHDAEDLTQDAFIRAYTKLGDLHDAAKLQELAPENSRQSVH